MKEYCYHWPHLSQNEVPRWLYFSSVSEHAIAFHDQVSDWLDDNPTVKLAKFQPGTYQLAAGIERLKRVYDRTEVLVLNREEAVPKYPAAGGPNDLHGYWTNCTSLVRKQLLLPSGPGWGLRERWK